MKKITIASLLFSALISEIIFGKSTLNNTTYSQPKNNLEEQLEQTLKKRYRNIQPQTLELILKTSKDKQLIILDEIMRTSSKDETLGSILSILKQQVNKKTIYHD